MKKLVFKKPPLSIYHEAYTEDIQRIVSACAEHGYALSEQDATIAWEKYSEDYYAAGWMMLPSEPAAIVRAILKVMEPENETEEES